MRLASSTLCPLHRWEQGALSKVTPWVVAWLGSYREVLECILIIKSLMFAITACSPWHCSSPTLWAQAEVCTCETTAEQRLKLRQSWAPKYGAPASLTQLLPISSHIAAHRMEALHTLCLDNRMWNLFWNVYVQFRQMGHLPWDMQVQHPHLHGRWEHGLQTQLWIQIPALPLRLVTLAFSLNLSEL